VITSIPMPCKKSELVSMVNSYVAAKMSGDSNLIAFSANALQAVIDTLEYSPEETQEDADKEEAAE
jgi:hypothetical protein